MKLWFENSFGEERVIADCQTEQEVFQEINKFIDQCNERNKARGVKLFEHYYTRIWYSNGRTHYDVGSHTEFFHWEGQHSA